MKHYGSEVEGYDEPKWANQDVTFQALAHSTRRTIIRLIQSKNQGISYTELITELGM